MLSWGAGRGARRAVLGGAAAAALGVANLVSCGSLGSFGNSGIGDAGFGDAGGFDGSGSSSGAGGDTGAGAGAGGVDANVPAPTALVMDSSPHMTALLCRATSGVHT